MTEQADREINAIRLHILDLIKSLYMEEPDQKKIVIWSKVISSLRGEHITPGMDSAVLKLDDLLSAIPLPDLQEEYYQLFINPFSDELVHTTLSYYVDGHDYGQSLVQLRQFLLNAGIARITEFDESEDSLVFLLDILETLIQDEERNPDSSRNNQSILLKQFLDPFSAHFYSALQQNEQAKFYEACAAFLAGYVDLEKGLMVHI